MTLWNFYFQLFEKAVGKEETVLFLGYPLQRISSPLLIVWDRLPAHRSRLVGEFLDQLQGWIVTEYLPPYAPELNPVEYLWGHWKQHELANVCPQHLWQLSEAPGAPCADARDSYKRSGNSLRLLSIELYYAKLSRFQGMYRLAVSPDGKLLASTDGESVKLWKLSDGSLAANLPVGVNRDEMSRVSFSPDGKLIAASNEPTGINKSKVRLWDVATRQPIGNPIPAQTFAFSPDSKMIAADGEGSKTVVLWNLQTRKMVRKPLLGAAARLRCISFSTDGNLLAAGGDDHNVIASDLHDKTAAGVPFVGHRGPVNDVAFSPVDNIMASASGDGSIILWNLETVQPLGVPLMSPTALRFVWPSHLTAGTSPRPSTNALSFGRCRKDCPSTMACRCPSKPNGVRFTLSTEIALQPLIPTVQSIYPMQKPERCQSNR